MKMEANMVKKVYGKDSILVCVEEGNLLGENFMSYIL
jgi:hypothetical protein